MNGFNHRGFSLTEVMISTGVMAALMASVFGSISLYYKQSMGVSHRINAIGVAGRIRQVLVSPSLCDKGLKGAVIDLDAIPSSGVPISVRVPGYGEADLGEGHKIDGVLIKRLAISNAHVVSIVGDIKAYGVTIEFEPGLTSDSHLAMRRTSYYTHLIVDDANNTVVSCAGDSSEQQICEAMGGAFDPLETNRCAPVAGQVASAGSGWAGELTALPSQAGTKERYLASCTVGQYEFFGQRWVDEGTGLENTLYRVDAKHELTGQVVCSLSTRTIPFSQSGHCVPFEQPVSFVPSSSGFDGTAGMGTACTANWYPDFTGDGGLFADTQGDGNRVNCCTQAQGTGTGLIDVCARAWDFSEMNSPPGEVRPPTPHQCQLACNQQSSTRNCYYFGQKINNL